MEGDAAVNVFFAFFLFFFPENSPNMTLRIALGTLRDKLPPNRTDAVVRPPLIVLTSTVPYGYLGTPMIRLLLGGIAALLCLYAPPVYSHAAWSSWGSLVPLGAEARAQRAYRRELTKWARGMGDRALADTEAELERQGQDNSIREMARAARAEIYRRASKSQGPAREFWAPRLRARLAEALEGAESASDFFGLLQDFTQRASPKRGGILSSFIASNIMPIMVLAPSPDELQYVRRSLPRGIDVDMYISLAAGLQRAKNGENLRHFFDALNRHKDPHYSHIRFRQKAAETLSAFVESYADELIAMPLPTDQISRLTKHTLIDADIALLGSVLKRADSADAFMDAFNTALTFNNAGHAYRRALEKFMIDHAEAISRLGLSFDQISTINRYIGRSDLFSVLKVGEKTWACTTTVALIVTGGAGSDADVPP